MIGVFRPVDPKHHSLIGRLGYRPIGRFLLREMGLRRDFCYEG
jgi:hypothetical protein